MRGATVIPVKQIAAVQFQSTHLMRGATTGHIGIVFVHQISIHAPHARCDYWYYVYVLLYTTFQSTHLMRGATGPVNKTIIVYKISIHAPHARCDSFVPSLLQV